MGGVRLAAARCQIAVHPILTLRTHLLALAAIAMHVFRKSAGPAEDQALILGRDGKPRYMAKAAGRDQNPAARDAAIPPFWNSHTAHDGTMGSLIRRRARG